MFKHIKDYIITIIGIMMLGVGLILVKTISNPHGIMLSLPFICVGIGSGAFGMGIGNIITARTVKNHPEMQKQMDIQKNDERNISISNKAKAKAYDIMLFVFSALMLSYALMQVGIAAILILVASYLSIIILRIYYHWKYDKEM